MSDDVTTTATTQTAQIYADPNIQYVTEPPTGQTYTVLPHPPSER